MTDWPVTSPGCPCISSPTERKDETPGPPCSRRRRQRCNLPVKEGEITIQACTTELKRGRTHLWYPSTDEQHRRLDRSRPFPRRTLLRAVLLEVYPVTEVVLARELSHAAIVKVRRHVERQVRAGQSAGKVSYELDATVGFTANLMRRRLLQHCFG